MVLCDLLERPLQDDDTQASNTVCEGDDGPMLSPELLKFNQKIM